MAKRKTLQDFRIEAEKLHKQFNKVSQAVVDLETWLNTRIKHKEAEYKGFCDTMISSPNNYMAKLNAAMSRQDLRNAKEFLEVLTKNMQGAVSHIITETASDTKLDQLRS